MQFEDVIRGRRSIRAYKPEAVPQEVIGAVLDEARWAPSWRNTQAWQVWVVTGAALERFKAGVHGGGGRRAAAGAGSGGHRRLARRLLSAHRGAHGRARRHAEGRR